MSQTRTRARGKGKVSGRGLRLACSLSVGEVGARLSPRPEGTTTTSGRQHPAPVVRVAVLIFDLMLRP